MTVEIRALREDDDRGSFDSGDEAIDLYFRRYAGQNQFRHHIGATYVAADGKRIIGFLTVAAASLDAEDLPDGRRMPPYPLPVLRLARLAASRESQRGGVGKVLLRHAIELAERMRDEFGCVGVLVDAKPDARTYYERFGFVELKALAGVSAIVPRPVPMFLPLGSVPKKLG